MYLLGFKEECTDEKALQTGLLLSLILLAAACSNNATTPGKKPAADQNQTEKAVEGEAKEATDEVDSSSNHSMTQAEVIEAVKDQIHTNLTIKLPHELPLDNGKHLTATTKSDENRYSVVFFKVMSRYQSIMKNWSMTVVQLTG